MLTQLREYLPADSNIIRFQRRFEVEPLPGTVTVAVRRTRHQLAALENALVVRTVILQVPAFRNTAQTLV
ncbi:hypothetical protein [Micromonospora profundi]|uniref:hypothetical protein n=1 Tax=Micromonospora profundi TaxID=1420889 RepID=UPI003810245C